MAEIFDPNATQDFDAETAVVARQQKLADFLRKQYGALQGQVPTQGQMVGGQWIAPSAGQAVVLQLVVMEQTRLTNLQPNKNKQC